MGSAAFRDATRQGTLPVVPQDEQQENRQVSPNEADDPRWDTPCCCRGASFDLGQRAGRAFLSLAPLPGAGRAAAALTAEACPAQAFPEAGAKEQGPILDLERFVCHAALSREPDPGTVRAAAPNNSRPRRPRSLEPDRGCPHAPAPRASATQP